MAGLLWWQEKFAFESRVSSMVSRAITATFENGCQAKLTTTEKGMGWNENVAIKYVWSKKIKQIKQNIKQQQMAGLVNHQRCQNVSTKTPMWGTLCFVFGSMWISYAFCVFVCLCLCDILALHLVQVVLSPQNPLETPEDREKVAFMICCTPGKNSYIQWNKVPSFVLINL